MRIQIQIKDIKKDTVFWEKHKSFAALEDGYCKGVIEIYGKTYNQYAVKAKFTENSDVINFLVTEGHEHYGPHLYTERQYGDMKFLKGKSDEN